MSVDLSTVKVTHQTHHQAQCNAMLKGGWVLLSVATGQWEDGDAKTVYTLGWTRDGEPAIPNV